MTPFSRRYFLFAFLSLFMVPLCAQEPAAKPKAPAAMQWEKLENVTYLPQRWDDGDSFHVKKADGTELILRLYFVDTCEEEKVYADRIRDQAAYFGIDEDRTKALGHEASAFTRKVLEKPFTVMTRWHKALGRSKQDRFYCVILTGEGNDLAALLVANGLARVYGTKITLWDGRTSKDYVKKLNAIEAEAKNRTVGGWRRIQ